MTIATAADRTAETTATTGTGTVSLAGAKTGYQAFSAAVSNGTLVYYCITNGTDWEVGSGTYTTSGSTLSRTTVLASSNSNNLVSFPSGSKDVFLDVPTSGIGPMVAAQVHAATSKTTPVDADEVGLWDSVSVMLQKLTWANIKATLKTYFDTLYPAYSEGTWVPTLTNITQVGPLQNSFTFTKKGREVSYIIHLGSSVSTAWSANSGSISMPFVASSEGASCTAVTAYLIDSLGIGVSTTTKIYPPAASIGGGYYVIIQGTYFV
jgi:hypothetical protein